MKPNLVRRSLPVIGAALLFSFLSAGRCHAQHEGDIPFQLVSGQIVLPERQLYTSVFLGGGFPPMPGPPPVESDEPGFEASDGALPPLAAVTLRVVQPLHYWSGGSINNPAPLGTRFQIESESGAVIEIDRSGIPENNSLVVGTSDEEGGFHQHAHWKLPETTAPDGAYGLVMQLSMPGALDSDPFLVVFAQRIPLSELETAAADILAASGIADDVLAADFNLDSSVDLADLDAWREGFGLQSHALLEGGDADRDADVDGADFLAWQRGFTAAQSLSAVPEPAGFIAAGFAAAAVATAKRRRFIA